MYLYIYVSMHLCIYASMYLYSNPLTHSISGEAGAGAWKQFKMRLKITIEWTQRCTGWPWFTTFDNGLGRQNRSKLEATIEWVWSPEWVHVEMHSAISSQRDWRRIWRRSMGGLLDTDYAVLMTFFAHICGNVMRWLYISALIETWMVAVNCLQRHARTCSNIHGSTCHCENEGKTHHLGLLLYLVYAVLGVNLGSRHGQIERDDLALCSVIMVEL